MKKPRLLAAVVAVVLAAAAVNAALSWSSPDRPATDAPPLAGATAPRGLPPHSAAIVADADDGEVLYADNPHRRVLIASTAKLMTALVTLERVPLDAVFTSPGYSGDGTESKLGLGTGEPMEVDDLLRGLLLVSGNDAAMTLAVGVAGSEQAFVALMNERARSLGMDDTHYGNPIGLDADTWSSAADLVTVTRELRRHAFFRATVASPQAVLESGSYRRVVRNTNDLVGAGPLTVNGVKTGHTDAAGYVLVGSATSRGRTVVSAVLGTKREADRDEATVRLLRYGLQRLK
jgi:D-alanyl-D-alanine carboxypeptidase (penicillin-binding protein 5/6)